MWGVGYTTTEWVLKVGKHSSSHKRPVFYDPIYKMSKGESIQTQRDQQLPRTWREWVGEMGINCS